MGLIADCIGKNKNSDITKVSRGESVEEAFLRKGIRSGHIVIPRNKLRRFPGVCGIGGGLTTKINTNIGISPDRADLKDEFKKLKVALEYGSDTIMDLSVGRGAADARKRILEKCPVPLGTVPVYEAAVDSDVSGISEADFLNGLRTHAAEGVDFFTIHAGVTRRTAAVLDKSRRLIRLVSRGGAILYRWMKVHKKENPFFSRFDEVMDIAREYDITLSLGDGMRPGSVADASDAAQFSELELLGELQKRALAKGVQVMIEGPGHVPIDQIKENVLREKKVCHGAPFYVLGPLVTDIAPGYDHITAAIGGALAATYGADYLCYVTPAEHLRHPTVDDVREGVIASKIAAHAADLARGVKNAVNRDVEISRARGRRDWEKQFALSIDPVKAAAYRASSRPEKKDVCTMCGNYCPIMMSEV